MSKVTIQLIKGSGELPKSLEKDSVVLFSSAGIPGSTFEWFITTKPQKSGAVLTSPNGMSTKLISMDEYGVYQVRLKVDESKVYHSSVSIPNPQDVGHHQASEPVYDFGNGIKNFSFEIPGILLGTAAEWQTDDDQEVLDENAGITRGRIIATNFITGSGEHSMCLGDDLGIKSNFKKGHDFSVSQNVDFTKALKIKVKIKFIKR